jgi:hypothetical protein
VLEAGRGKLVTHVSREGVLRGKFVSTCASQPTNRAKTVTVSRDFTNPSSSFDKSAASEGVMSPFATAATRAPVAAKAS